MQEYRYAPRMEKIKQEAKMTPSVRNHFTRPNHVRQTRLQSSDIPPKPTSTVSEIPLTKKEEKSMDTFRMSILGVSQKESLLQLDERAKERDRIRREKIEFQPSRYLNSKYEKRPEAKKVGKAILDNIVSISIFDCLPKNQGLF